MTWQDAWQIIKDIPTDDYISGKWVPIRYEKCKALFELAGQVKPGTSIVDLGTWRGLAAIVMALGSDPSVIVHTLDDYSDRRVEEVANVGLRYNMDDYAKYQANISKLPPEVAKRIVQHQREIIEAAKDWTNDVGLVFWDLWGERLIDDIKAWTPHVVPGGLVVVKVFEDGRLKHERLYDLPDLEKGVDYPQGAIYTLRKLSKLGETIKGMPPVSHEHALWIVDGEPYLSEAKRSAESVMRHMPYLTADICMPQERKHDEWFIEATRILCDVLDDLPDDEKILWLDSDTYALDSVKELFVTLDKFDMVMAHAPGHVTAKTVMPVPDTFPEFNIGVIAMKNTYGVREVWREVYRRQQAHPEYAGTDQAPLREVLYHYNTVPDNAITYAVMPCEYNFRFHFGGQVRDKVKLLHGRAPSAEAYETIGRSVNAGYVEGYQLPPRLWSIQRVP